MGLDFNQQYVLTKQSDFRCELNPSRFIPFQNFLDGKINSLFLSRKNFYLFLKTVSWDTAFYFTNGYGSCKVFHSFLSPPLKYSENIFELLSKFLKMFCASNQKIDVHIFREMVLSKGLHLVFSLVYRIATLLSLFIMYLNYVLFSNLKRCLKTMLHCLVIENIYIHIEGIIINVNNLIS